MVGSIPFVSFVRFVVISLDGCRRSNLWEEAR